MNYALQLSVQDLDLDAGAKFWSQKARSSKINHAYVHFGSTPKFLNSEGPSMIPSTPKRERIYVLHIKRGFHEGTYILSTSCSEVP